MTSFSSFFGRWGVLAVSLFVLAACTPRADVSLSRLGDDERAAFSAAYSFPTVTESHGEARVFDVVAREIETSFVDDLPLAVWSYADGVEPAVLRVREGDRVQISLRNALSVPTTVHWHGLRVPHAMDGVPEMTQPAIEPGEVFVYDFIAGDVGTFWFHPHEQSHEQVGRGLFALLIVEEAEPPAYDADLVWALKDYRLTADGKLAEDWNNAHDLTHAGRLGNIATINNQLAPRMTELAPGSRVRLRLINTSNARLYDLDLRDFSAQLIAVDGGYTAEPTLVADLLITPGERYELDFVMPADRTLSLVDRWSGQPLTLASFVSTGELVATPDFSAPTAAVPDWSMLADFAPDYELILDGVGVMGGGALGHAGHAMARVSAWRIGQEAWPDTTPIVLADRELAIIRFTNNSIFDHPMHLHGDFFQILAIDGLAPAFRGFKDTVNVPAHGTVDIALVPTNPGEWMLHCHILEHAEIGMMTTIRVE